MSMSLEFLLLCVVFSMLQCYHANGEDYCRLHDLKALNVNLRALRTEYNDYKIEKEREFKKYKDELKASSKKIHDLDVKLNGTIAELEWLRNKASDVPSSPCNEEWTAYNGSVYLVHNKIMNFADAKSFCNNSGAHLINIGDGAENDFIKGVLSTFAGGWFWLGVSDEATEDVWLWQDTGLEVAFTAWRPGEPDGGPSSNCAVMSRWESFQWLDVSCSGILIPICERRA